MYSKVVAMLICVLLGFSLGAFNAYRDYKLYGIFKSYRFLIESLLLSLLCYQVCSGYIIALISQ